MAGYLSNKRKIAHNATEAERDTERKEEREYCALLTSETIRERENEGRSSKYQQRAMDSFFIY